MCGRYICVYSDHLLISCFYLTDVSRVLPTFPVSSHFIQVYRYLRCLLIHSFTNCELKSLPVKVVGKCIAYLRRDCVLTYTEIVCTKFNFIKKVLFGNICLLFYSALSEIVFRVFLYIIVCFLLVGFLSRG